MKTMMKMLLSVLIVMLLATPTLAYEGVAVQTNGLFIEAMEGPVLVYVGAFGAGIGTRVPTGRDGVDLIGTFGVIDDGFALQGLVTYPFMVREYAVEARGGVELDVTNGELKVVVGVGYMF